MRLSTWTGATLSPSVAIWNEFPLPTQKALLLQIGGGFSGIYHLYLEMFHTTSLYCVTAMGLGHRQQYATCRPQGSFCNTYKTVLCQLSEAGQSHTIKHHMLLTML